MTALVYVGASGSAVPVSLTFDGALQLLDVQESEVADLQKAIGQRLGAKRTREAPNSPRQLAQNALHCAQRGLSTECLRWLHSVQRVGTLRDRAALREFLASIPDVRDPHRLPFAIANLGNVNAVDRRAKGDTWDECEWGAARTTFAEAAKIMRNLDSYGNVRYRDGELYLPEPTRGSIRAPRRSDFPASADDIGGHTLR